MASCVRSHMRGGVIPTANVAPLWQSSGWRGTDKWCRRQLPSFQFPSFRPRLGQCHVDDPLHSFDHRKASLRIRRSFARKPHFQFPFLRSVTLPHSVCFSEIKFQGFRFPNFLTLPTSLGPMAMTDQVSSFQFPRVPRGEGLTRVKSKFLVPRVPHSLGL